MRTLVGWLWLLLLGAQGTPSLLEPGSEEMNRQAPERFRVKFETSRGDFYLEVVREWAPLGADRFYSLVRAGFYDQARFFRVRRGDFVQFGIHAEPRVSAVWRDRRFPDDPVKETNRRGRIAYAMKGPDDRTTQVFINLKDNSHRDGEGFSPFGEVMEGMEVLDRIYADYGESAGGGIRGGKQEPLFAGGNAYLDANFPRLDSIKSASVLP
jgi:homoserine O-acetyltransferase